jgi:pseudouridine-5'-phosphate glycosidase
MITLSEEVSAALSANVPVVALESTIVAHGMPWPENFEVGRALEEEVRAHGAVPATIAVIGGKLTAGLDNALLEKLARGSFKKVGVGDLGMICAHGLDGATTVSATTFAAARAGIRVFATGGIGGVHRGDSLDVSSDLTTIAKEPVAVVSAGAKAILDLPRTLEMLETLGVPVVGVRTNDFPAFYVGASGLSLEHRVEGPDDAAKLLRTHWSLGLGGLLLANPIPKAHELDRRQIDKAIEDALADAKQKNIRGKAITPHLLSFVSKATAKRSLQANRILALNNAAFAADVAVALSKLAIE